MDMQFLPDVTISCPECRGSRYGRDAGRVRHGENSPPELIAMDVTMALRPFRFLQLGYIRPNSSINAGRRGYFFCNSATIVFFLARPPNSASD